MLSKPFRHLSYYQVLDEPGISRRRRREAARYHASIRESRWVLRQIWRAAPWKFAGGDLWFGGRGPAKGDPYIMTLAK